MDHRPTSASRSRSATWPAATSTSPTRCSCAAPPPRSVRGELRRRPRDPLPRARSPRRSPRSTTKPCGRGRPYKDWVERLSRHERARRGARARPAWPGAVEIFDTTLRDGAQFEGISLTVDDKLRIAEQLDHLGVHWIEGGYPQANPKDDEFFRRAATELELAPPTLVAFGSTRRPAGQGRRRPHPANLVESPAPRRSASSASRWDYHVTEALRTTLDEGVAMVADSVRSSRPRAAGLLRRRALLRRLQAQPRVRAAGARGRGHGRGRRLVLCDTNGGSLPHEVERITAEVVPLLDDVTVGIHTQNDTGCAVANAIAGVRRRRHPRAGHDQRLRRAHRQLRPHDRSSPTSAEDGHRHLPEGRIERLTSVSTTSPSWSTCRPTRRALRRLLGVRPQGRPAHSAPSPGAPTAYEHVDPAAVGNGTRLLVSDLGRAGPASIKAEELGIELDAPGPRRLVDELKRARARGYHFEAADASLELLMRRAAGWEQDFFGSSRSGSIVVPPVALPPLGEVAVDVDTEATVKLWVGDERIIAVGEGNGPVNALDAALRRRSTAATPAARPTSTSPTSRCGCSTPQGHRGGHPGAHRLDRRRPAPGPPSACRRTSSRRRGRRSSTTRSSTGPARGDLPARTRSAACPVAHLRAARGGPAARGGRRVAPSPGRRSAPRHRRGGRRCRRVGRQRRRRQRGAGGLSPTDATISAGGRGSVRAG
jgi:2-isopropylmalate synthase